MNLVEIDRLNTLEVSIDWFIGKRCNFDCVYCRPEIHDNYSPHQDLKHLQVSAQKFIDHFGAKNLQIGITGGEPTVNKSLPAFCSFLKNKGVEKLAVTTNGSRTADYYIELSKSLGTLTFSQHYEFTTLDFLDKIKIVNEHKECKNLFVQVMANVDYWNDVIASVEFYKKYNINYTLRRIRDHSNSLSAANYSNEHLEWMLSQQSKNIKSNCKIVDDKNNIKEVHVNEISNSKLNRFKGWRCWAGLKHFHIWHDGTVFRGNCRQGGSLGNIKTQFTIPDAPVICNTDVCFCAPEITVRKKL